MGDFNAKLGNSKENEQSVGHFGLGNRNERGQTLVNFLEQHQLYAMNTFFKKRPSRKWTWASPDGKTRNEIDYIISAHKNNITDVTVLNRFKTSSDHRLVRATFKCNVAKERAKLFKQQNRKYDRIGFKFLQTEYQLDLNNQFNKLDEENLDINYLNDALCKILVETTDKHIGNRKQTKSESKLTPKTLALLDLRRSMQNKSRSDQREIEELNKLIHKAIRRDIRKFNTKIITETIRENKGPKVFRRKLNISKSEICQLKDPAGHATSDREQIIHIVEEFYTDLYASKVTDPKLLNAIDLGEELHQENEDLPPILVDEISFALSLMKNGKASGEDGICVEMLAAGGTPVLDLLGKLFNKVLYSGTTPKAWNNAVVTILHKKGDKSKLANYRPISLLSQIYKLFAKVLCNRLSRLLDEYQPIEQAGFRKGFSTLDHIHTIKQLMEKGKEFNQPLCFAFVDYEKAFDSVEHWAVFRSLHNSNIDSRYVDILRELYRKATLQVRMHKLTDFVPIKRGVRQGDTLSPKLFTNTLEDIMKALDWEERGISINGTRMSHLRFADDLILLSGNVADLQSMLTDLHEASLKVGLRMNMSKTKIMASHTIGAATVNVGNCPIDLVDHYIYLGHRLSFDRESQAKEIDRRVQLGWAAFGKLDDIFRSNIPQCLKTKAFNQCILPILTYGAETWSLTKGNIHKIKVAQRAMQRTMLGIFLVDRIPNVEIRRKTQVVDVGKRITELKWSWAGHVARRDDGRWAKAVTEWWPRDGQRKPGRPPARWVDDIVGAAGRQWMRLAQDREEWRKKKEAYAQQWVDTG